MKTVKIHAQGDDLVVEIPDGMASELNWVVGTELTVDSHQEAVTFRMCRRQPRGAFTVIELLRQIDKDEIKRLNASVCVFPPSF